MVGTRLNRRVTLTTAVLALLALAAGAAVTGVAAQSTSVTFSADDVSVAGQGDTGTSSIVVEQDEPVENVDIRVSVDDTSVANITGATAVDPQSANVDINRASDGSYVWLNVSNFGGGANFAYTMADVEFTSQTPQQSSGSANIGLTIKNAGYLNQNGGAELFDIVNTNGANLQAGATSNFVVNNLNPLDGEVQQNDDLTVSADIENTGDIDGTATPDFLIDGTPIDSKSVPVNAGQTESVEFTVNNVELETGTYTHEIATGDDSATGSLEVTPGQGQPGDDFTFGTPSPASVSPPAGTTTTVFQGQDIDVPDGYTGASGPAEGKLLQDTPIPSDQVTGTYTATDGGDIIVITPRVTSFELINPNGNEVTEANENTPLLLGVEYSYSGAVPVEFQMLDSDGNNLINEVGNNADFDDLTPEQEARVSKYDIRIPVEFNNSGAYEAIFSPNPADASDSQIGAVSSAVQSTALNIVSENPEKVTFSAEDVQMTSQGDTATSSIVIEQTDEPADNVDIKVSATDPSVANITGATAVDPQSANVIFNRASDGSFVWVNASGGFAGGNGYTIADVEFTSQTPQQSSDSAGIRLTTNNAGYVKNGQVSGFDEVNTKNATASVIRPVNFLLSNVSPTEATVVRGNSLKLSANVTNVGGLQGTQDVAATVGGTVLDNESVTLTSGESRVVDLSLDTSGLDYGETGFSVGSRDDTAAGTLKIVENLVPANVSSGLANARPVGETANSSIQVDAPNGLSTADVTVSVNTSVAEIVGVSEGSDVNPNDSAVNFEVEDRTDGSVTLNYTNIRGTGAVQGYEVAEVELARRSNGTETRIGLSTANFVYVKSNQTIPYAGVNPDEGLFTDVAFTEPLPGGEFEEPPQNIPPQKGGISEGLTEDLDGDGNPTDIAPTVRVFGELIRGNDLGLSERQARSLNWNPDSPDDKVTPADIVSLFGKQIRLDN